MNKKELEQLNKIKEELVKTHKKCSGTGYSIKDKKSIKCECMKIFSYIIDLVKSNIPIDYWNLSLNKLEINEKHKTKVEKYIHKIDNAIQKGIGMYFFSNTRGVGKTSLACEIAKEAIRKRYVVYYNLLQVIISDKFTDNQEIIEKIKDADLVVIDEIDKVAMKKESNLSFQIENFLREILPSGKPVIMCSNMNLNEVEEKIEIQSLINRYCIITEVKGEDFSKKKNNKLDDLLDEKLNYFSKELISSSQKHYENENKYYEKQYKENIEG